jgi:hypothetical protein
LVVCSLQFAAHNLQFAVCSWVSKLITNIHTPSFASPTTITNNWKWLIILPRSTMVLPVLSHKDGSKSDPSLYTLRETTFIQTTDWLQISCTGRVPPASKASHMSLVQSPVWANVVFSSVSRLFLHSFEIYEAAGVDLFAPGRPARSLR